MGKTVDKGKYDELAVQILHMTDGPLGPRLAKSLLSSIETELKSLIFKSRIFPLV